MCRMERVPLARIPRVLVKNVPLFQDKSESPTTLSGGALAHSVGSYQRKVVSNEEDASPTPVVCARCCLLVYIPLSNSLVILCHTFINIISLSLSKYLPESRLNQLIFVLQKRMNFYTHKC